jgi:pyruvate-formate lyase-activating enzyme
MSLEPGFQQHRAHASKPKALVICAHLRPGRDKRRTNYLMQPISGLHVASLIDQSAFDICLHHEDWHGPLETADCKGYDLVFLSGLQVDFDRLRQLSFYFRRSGATVVAGGSICTTFPEFASQFFDAVCAGGVDSVPIVVSDFLNNSLKPIYRSPIARISSYALDYSIFTKSRIRPVVHLIEATRGCSFKCSFCVIPSEVGGHASYDFDQLTRTIDNAISSSPRLSFRRLYPIVMLLDNNFSDNREHMLRVCGYLRSNRRVRGWVALVTQNVLHDREFIRHLAASKCLGLFVGLESFDPDLLRRYRKTQNLSKRFNVIDDIAYAESQGITITYGYLFDPRYQKASEMERQICAIAENPLIPMPIYISVVAPLAGTESFWDDLNSGRLAPNLRLRDLDGETIAYSQLADRPEAIVSFVEKIFRRPWTVVGRASVLLKTLRRLARSRTFNPIRWYFMAIGTSHCFIWSRGTPSQPRSYLAGSDTLDPQYIERPDDLRDTDRATYFDPIYLTDATGRPSDWLKPYYLRRASRNLRRGGSNPDSIQEIAAS